MRRRRSSPTTSCEIKGCCPACLWRLRTASAACGSTRTQEPEDEALIDAYQARILSVLGVGWPLANGKANELSPRTLSLSAEAAALWRQFFDHIEGQSGRNGELWPVRDFAAKAAEHAARIAG